MAVGIAFARETSHAWYGVELRFAAGVRGGLFESWVKGRGDSQDREWCWSCVLPRVPCPPPQEPRPARLAQPETSVVMTERNPLNKEAIHK